MIEDEQTILERLYLILRMQMSSQIPTPGGIHIYSSGATIMDFQASTFPAIAFNQQYSASMLGFDIEGNYLGETAARIPKPTKSNPNPKHLEKYNFGIIERCTISAAKLVALSHGGKVVNDLK